jgi:hypothetical protein
VVPATTLPPFGRRNSVTKIYALEICQVSRHPIALRKITLRLPPDMVLRQIQRLISSGAVSPYSDALLDMDIGMMYTVCA